MSSLPSAWEIAREVLDCRDWVWRCFFVNELGFDQFWLFCFLRSWSTREEPLWTKSKLPKTPGLAKPWTLSKRPQAHRQQHSPSRPCLPERAAHSSSHTRHKSTKNNTAETLEDSSTGLSSWAKDNEAGVQAWSEILQCFSFVFWCDPFQRGKKKNPGLCWIPTSHTALLKATFWYLHTFTLYFIWLDVK